MVYPHPISIKNPSYRSPWYSTRSPHFFRIGFHIIPVSQQYSINGHPLGSQTWQFHLVNDDFPIQKNCCIGDFAMFDEFGGQYPQYFRDLVKFRCKLCTTRTCLLWRRSPWSPSQSWAMCLGHFFWATPRGVLPTKNGGFYHQRWEFFQGFEANTDTQGVSLARVGILFNNCYCSYWEPQIIEVIVVIRRVQGGFPQRSFYWFIMTPIN